MHAVFKSAASEDYKEEPLYPDIAEHLEKTINCLIVNFEDFQTKAYYKPIKVGFPRVYDQYNSSGNSI